MLVWSLDIGIVSEFDPSNYKVEFRCHDKTVMQGKRVFPHEDKPMDVQYGRIGYECQFGKERNAAAKRKYRRKLEEKEKLVSSLFQILFYSLHYKLLFSEFDPEKYKIDFQYKKAFE